MTFELNETQTSNLKALLGRDFPEAKFPALKSAVESAAHIHDMGLKSESDCSPKEQQEYLSEMLKAFMVIERNLRLMGSGNTHVLDQLYRTCKKNIDSGYLQSFRNNLVATNENRSSYQILVEQLRNTAEIAKNNLPPIRGGKNPDLSYTNCLSVLADFFVLELPNFQVSRAETSLFYKVSLFLIRDVLGHEISDHRRHIENLIRLRNK